MSDAATIGAAELLELAPLGDGRFRAPHTIENGRNAIFGGQAVAQALAAARRTTAGWPANSLTGAYLRAGATGVPIDYAVEAVRDGRRYAQRRVLASQAGKPIFDMLCSFHDPEEGPRHQLLSPPASPPPATLESTAAYIRRHADRLPAFMVETYAGAFPIELRPIDPEGTFLHRKKEARRAYWFRMPSAAGIEDPGDHQSLLAFISDFWIAGTPSAPHFETSEVGGVATVTLNHSLWFHAPARADGWLLYDTDSPWAGEGRGLARGLIYDEGGALVASTMQETSIRRL